MVNEATMTREKHLQLLNYWPAMNSLSRGSLKQPNSSRNKCLVFFIEAHASHCRTLFLCFCHIYFRWNYRLRYILAKGSETTIKCIVQVKKEKCLHKQVISDWLPIVVRSNLKENDIDELRQVLTGLYIANISSRCTT